MKFEGSYLSVLPEVLRLCVPSACLTFGVSSLHLANVYHVVPSQNSPCATHPLHSSQPPHPPTKHTHTPKHTPHPSKSDFIERKKAKNMSVSSPVLMSLENVSSVAKRRAEGKYFGCIWSLKKKKKQARLMDKTHFSSLFISLENVKSRPEPLCCPVSVQPVKGKRKTPAVQFCLLSCKLSSVWAF